METYKKPFLEIFDISEQDVVTASDGIINDRNWSDCDE